MAPAPRRGSRARRALVQRTAARLGSLQPDAVRPRREAAEDARAEVEAERRQFLVLLIAAANQEARGGLAIGRAKAVEYVEADHRHEHRAAAGLKMVDLVERQPGD